MIIVSTGFLHLNRIYVTVASTWLLHPHDCCTWWRFQHQQESCIHTTIASTQLLHLQDYGILSKWKKHVTYNMGGMDNSPTASHHCPLNSSHQANRMPGQFTIGQFTLDKQNAWSVHHWTVHTGQTGCLVNSPLNSSHRANRTPGQFTTRQFTTRQFTLGKQNAWSIHHHTVHHQAVHTRQTECLVNSPPDRSPPSSSHWANRTPGQFTTRQFTPGKQNAWSIHWTVHTRQTEPLVNSPPDSSHWANRTPGQFTTGQFFYLYHQESSTLFGPVFRITHIYI